MFSFIMIIKIFKIFQRIYFYYYFISIIDSIWKVALLFQIK